MFNTLSFHTAYLRMSVTWEPTFCQLLPQEILVNADLHGQTSFFFLSTLSKYMTFLSINNREVFMEPISKKIWTHE